MNKNHNTEDEHIFANLANSALDVDDDSPGDASHNEDIDNQQQTNQDKKRIQELEDELAAQREALNRLNPHLETVEKLENVFRPKSESEADIKEKKIREFDIDPLTGVKNIVKDDIEDIRSELNSIKSTRITEKAMSEIDRDFEVDWEGNRKKIAKELQTLDRAWRSQNPKLALLKAAKLAGVVKKKDRMPTVLHPGYTPKEREQYVKSRADQIIESIERGRPSESTDVMKELFG